MRALILNGGHHGDLELDAVQESLLVELGTRGWKTEALVLRKMPIAYCTGCFECWTKTPGVYARYPALLVIGWLPKPEPEEEPIFHALVRRNALNMHVPGFASGIVYAGDGASANRLLDRLLDRLGSAA